MIAARLVNNRIVVELLPEKLLLRMKAKIQIQRINGKAVVVFRNPLSGLTCVAELL